ncbi:MAG: hypothetical protein MJ132_04825 [Clostridia bacterium]|nr:hypothetical protein [Clostridia bacterium]
MSSSLKVIQTLAKIGKILSKIVYICCIIGMIGCLVGGICFACFGKGSVHIGSFEIKSFGDIQIHGLIEEDINLSVGAIYAAILTGFIASLGGFITSTFGVRYFKHQLDAGTPFTFEGAKKMLHLGIAATVVPIAVDIVTSITESILENFMKGVHRTDTEVDIGLGIMFIILSFILKYGAEIKEDKNA